MIGNTTVTMCTTQRVRNLIQSKSNLFRRIVVNRTCLASFLILVFLVRHASPDCSLNFEQYKLRRITALRFQILTKLGFSTPPEDYGPDEVPEHLISLYQETADLIEEKYCKNHKPCNSSSSEVEDEEDKYFAQVPMIFTAAESWPDSSNQYFYSRERFARFFWFDISDLEGRGPRDITEATFRLFQVSNSQGMMDQVISVHQLIKKEGEYDTRHIFTKSFNPQKNGSVSIDVTEVVRSWVTDPESNYGFQVGVECGAYQAANPWNSLEIEFADPRGSYTASQQRGDMSPRNKHTSEKHPKLIVMTSGNYSNLVSSSEANSRRKRSYPSNKRCDDTVASCCKRVFYVNFERDLGLSFIRQPKGFYPNYCAGNCLYIRADNSMYHQLIAYHRSTNPDGSPSPCCSPLSFKPLTVLYYEKSRPQIASLQNVVVDSCRCS